MINVRSVSHKSRKTGQMLISHPDDRPLGIQLLGKDPYYILRAMEVIKNYSFDVLDFNAACPAKKIIRRGEGARPTAGGGAGRMGAGEHGLPCA